MNNDTFGTYVGYVSFFVLLFVVSSSFKLTRVWRYGMEVWYSILVESSINLFAMMTEVVVLS